MKRIGNKTLFYKKKKARRVGFGAPTFIGTLSLVLAVGISIYSFSDRVKSFDSVQSESSIISSEHELEGESVFLGAPDEEIISIELESTEPEIVEIIEGKVSLSDTSISAVQVYQEPVNKQSAVENNVEEGLAEEIIEVEEKTIETSEEDVVEGEEVVIIDKAEEEEIIFEEEVINSAPIITSQPSSSSVFYGNQFQYLALAEDIDGDILSFDFTGSELDPYSDPRVDGSSLLSNHRFVFTPSEFDIGKTYSFSVTVSDGELADIQHFSITVLDPGVEITISNPVNGQSFNVGENVFFVGSATYVGIPVNWMSDQFAWSVSKDGISYGSMLGENATNSFSEPGTYTITFIVQNPESGEVVSSTIIVNVVESSE